MHPPKTNAAKHTIPTCKRAFIRDPEQATNPPLTQLRTPPWTAAGWGERPREPAPERHSRPTREDARPTRARIPARKA